MGSRLFGPMGQASLTNSKSTHSGVISTASVILMNSSFLLIAISAPRTFPATTADPRCSTQTVNSHDCGFESQLILIDLEE
ncbi:hypothetical protein ABIA48_000161 [Pseudomonas sp. S30_BP2TU TE3576]